jgi:hypothetical protein
MKPKTYNEEHILNSVFLGIEFEFFSKLKNTEVSRSLAKEIGKRVVIPYAIPPLGNKPKPMYHSPVEVTNNIFKLEPDYSGGLEMFELVTGPMPYKEAKEIISKVLEWIDKYGYTTEKCSIHINMSFDNNKVETINTIDKLDIMKFVLSFDEKYIYDRFPNRESSVYARSINSIIPNSFFFYSSPPADFSIKNSFNLPEEKYFGINFTKREKGYLEFRYLGGKDYEKKSKKIFEAIDHMALSFFNVLNSTDYTAKEKEKIRKIYDKHQELVRIFNNYDLFVEKYPKIIITVDLKDNEQIIKSFWESIRMDIFNLVVVSGLTSGRYNYDTDFGIKQLVEADLKRANIKNFDIINCTIEGIISKCDLYNSTFIESRLADCQAMRNNKFENCKIQHTILHPTNETKNCYIENKNLLINCKIENGVIRSGEIGALAEVSKETKIVETSSLNIAATTPNGEKKDNVIKPKDWQWIKSLKNKNNI